MSRHITTLVLFFLPFDVPLNKNKDWELINQLAHDSFRVREKAHQKLIGTMEVSTYYRIVAYMSKHDADAEAVRRIKMILPEAPIHRFARGYRVDLKGYKDYPQIDEGMIKDYALNGPWADMKWGDVKAIYTGQALRIGTDNDYPTFMRLRKAMELFIQERIEYNVGDCLIKSYSEIEFKNRMKERMDAIQKDLDMFIERDKAFYTRMKIPNPFLP